MTRPLESIVVVGGGTAGWLTAAYFSRAFGTAIKIYVVESERIGRIGVGEATVPTVRDTLAFCGLDDETEWMADCNATFKSAVKFVNWRTTPDGSDHVYYHPFMPRSPQLVRPFDRPMFPRIGEGFAPFHYWLERHLRGDPTPYAESCMLLDEACKLNRAPRYEHGSVLPDPGLRYAYHFDATLVAEKLARVAKARGVEHVVADVTQVVLHPDGRISHLETEQGLSVRGDFFIDCSGFRGLLINQALKEPFISDNEFLLCDSAVAMPAPSDPDRDGLRPYTTATAKRDGWIWEIPLSHREGCGYVYCSQTTDKESAERTLRQHLGEDRVKDSSPNHIKMRVGRNRRSWVKNCASVGLSSCFVEPLESTTIFLIEYEVASLALHLPDCDFDQANIDNYNELLAGIYEDVRDFIVLHYHLTDREDSEFWRRVRAAPIPESLAKRLASFRSGVLVPDGLAIRLFEGQSVAAILTGMRFPFEKSAPALAHFGQEQARATFAAIADQRAHLRATLPDHWACVRSVYAARGKRSS